MNHLAALSGAALNFETMQMTMFEANASAKIVKTEPFKEYHKNGALWIVGQIALVKDEHKDEYDYRTGFSGYEGLPVARVGKWVKYHENGQFAWEMDYADGTYKGLEEMRKKERTQIHTDAKR